MSIRHRVLDERIHPTTKFQSGNTVISLLQKRNLSDRPEIGPLKFGTKRGVHIFLLQAKLCTSSDDGQRKLVGVVTSVPALFAEYLYSAHAAFQDDSLPMDDPLPAKYDAFLNTLREDVGAGHFALKFELADDGIICFTSIANASSKATEGALLAFEAYSFLKDVLHKHRFHHAADDALLELVPAASIENPLWFRSVVRNLHRSIISSFRAGSRFSQANALGKLAYLESFIRVLDRRGLKADPSISTATLREALIQYQSSGQEDKEDKNLRSSFFLSMVAILIPVLLVCLQLLQIPCIDGLTYAPGACIEKFYVAPTVVSFAALVLKRLDYAILGSIVLFAAAAFVIWRRRLVRYNEARTTDGIVTGDMRELLLRLGVSHAKAAPLLMGVVILLFVVLIGWIVRWLLVHPF